MTKNTNQRTNVPRTIIHAMRRLLVMRLILALCLLAPLELSGQSCTTAVCNAASPSRSDVLAALPSSTTTQPTVVVNIPSGTATWTSELSYTVPAAVTSLTIQGATTVNCTGTAGTSGYLCTPTNNTVIVDGIATGGSSVMKFALGSNAGLVFRITGISLTGTGTGGKYNGEIQIASGASQNVRIDHNSFSDASYTNSTKFFLTNAAIAGVADHNAVYMQRFWQNDNGFVVQGPYNDGTATGDGDGTWANPTLWGSLHTFYVESNYVQGGYLDDCAIAGAIVLRYNYFDSPGALLQTHGTKSSAFGRACRLAEAYHNYVTNSNGSSGDAFFGQKGSPVMVWGNTVGPHGGSSWFFDGCTDRSCGSTTETAVPNGWWYCGTSAPGNPGGTSPYDGNSSTSTGYPCIDGIGRGQNSSPLNGQWFPNENLISTGSPGWPQQMLEPTYMFANDFGTLGNGVNIHDTSSTNNRDYYWDCGPLNSSCSSSFNGTKGTGSGLLSARPATCTAGPGGTYGASPTGSYGVGYWGTDTNTFYVCTATNTWTAVYQPAVYPHPLVSGAVATPSFSPPSGTYATPQTVSIYDDTGTAAVQITTNEGSNANASNGDTPSRNLYTNCATSCVSGVWQPVNSGIVSNGQLACTTAAQSSGVANGCSPRSVVSTTITGTGTHALDNGKGAGGNDSATAMTATYGGSTANPCSSQFSGLSAGWLGLNFPVPVSNSAAFYSLTTASSNYNTSLLAPNKNTMTQALSDAIDHYLTVSCMDINNTSASGVHAEFDTNHTISTDDYFGFGKHFNFSTSKMYYCLQGCSSWKEMDLKEPNGTVHTTFSWPANHKIFIATVDHRNPGCTSSSGSSCEFYDAACYQDVTAGTPQICGNWIDAVTGNTPGGIPVHKSGFTVNEVNTQTQIDINAPSVTISQNVWRTFVGYNLNGVQVFYTNNGATPTTSSTPYVFPVSVATSQTLKALATAPGLPNSSVGSATYTITAGTNYTFTITAPNATVSGTNNTSGTYASGTTMGAYTITPASGYMITSITGTGSTAGCTSSPCGPYTLGANSSITVTTVQQTVATPTFSPPTGTYVGTQTVTIATATSGATLHYTTDGSSPTCSSTTYSTPISVSTSETVKAIGCESGYLDSAIGSAAYVINSSTVHISIQGTVNQSGSIKNQ